MTHLPLQLSLVLDRLPVAVGLVARTGRFLGTLGGMSGRLGKMVPSCSSREAGRWRFTDSRGSAIPPSEWPSGRALRGEQDYAGMVGAFTDGEECPIKVVSIPTLNHASDVACVAFVQFLETRSPSIEGSHHDLQQRLIDQIARSISEARPVIMSDDMD